MISQNKIVAGAELSMKLAACRKMIEASLGFAAAPKRRADVIGASRSVAERRLRGKSSQAGVCQIWVYGKLFCLLTGLSCSVSDGRRGYWLLPVRFLAVSAEPSFSA